MGFSDKIGDAWHDANDKLSTVTNSPMFMADNFRMPLDLSYTTKETKLKTRAGELAEVQGNIDHFKAKNNPKYDKKLQNLASSHARISGDMKHLNTLKSGEIISKDFSKYMGKTIGTPITKVLNKLGKPISAIARANPRFAKGYKVYAGAMDTIGLTSMFSPLGEMGYNAIRASRKAPPAQIQNQAIQGAKKLKAASEGKIKTASTKEKAAMYNTCRNYPKEFCLNSPESYGLIADRIFKQASYVYEDKGFINGGYRPIPDIEKDTDPFYIRIVHTNPDHQGQGVGKDMIQEVINLNPSESGYWMMVNDDNAGMQKCASKLGFSKIHELTQDNGSITDILYKEN